MTAVVFFFALLGYVGFGFFSKTPRRAVAYSFLWGVAIFMLLGALGGEGQPYGFDVSAACFNLHYDDAVIFDVGDYASGVFALFAVCFASHQIFAIIITVIFYARGKFDGDVPVDVEKLR